MRKIIVIALCVLLCGTSAFALSKEQLTVGISQEFDYFHPHILNMVAGRYIQEMCIRALMTLDTKGKWQTMMIKEIPSIENGLAEFVEENGVKKIKAQYELKDNLKWGDGQPITNEDVKFSWEVGMHPNVPVPERDIWNRIERIEIDPANPLKFTCYSPMRWDFNQLSRFYVIAKHLEEPVFKQHIETAGSYEKNSLYITDVTNPGLYQGPYRISEAVAGSHVTLVPNEYFWGDAPYFQKIIFKIIPDTGTLEANLLSGTIDMICRLGLTLDQALAIEKRFKEQNQPYTVLFQPGIIYEHIDLQLSNPILQDKRVRKALVYAIDRDALTQAMFEGKQPKSIHLFAPIDPWYTEDPSKIVLYEYSPRKARQLLDEAGWVVGNDGYRYKDGEKLSLQLMTTAGNKTREMVEAWLQEEWKKVGIEITIKNEPARVYFSETVRKSQFPAMAMYAWTSAPETNPRSLLHSSSIPTEANNYAGNNPPRWSNPEVDKLIDEVDMTFEHAKRVELTSKILYYYTEEVPVIPLYSRADSAVIPNNLAGYEISPHQCNETNWVEYWRLKE